LLQSISMHTSCLTRIWLLSLTWCPFSFSPNGCHPR
jgi:hypothetical protein